MSSDDLLHHPVVSQTDGRANNLYADSNTQPIAGASHGTGVTRPQFHMDTTTGDNRISTEDMDKLHGMLDRLDEMQVRALFWGKTSVSK